MTPEELAAIRERANAATPGPWKIIRETDEYGRALNSWQVDALYPSAELADAEFVAQSRADIPALLDEVERLRAMLRQLEWRHEYAEEMWPDGLKECVVCHNRKMNGHAIGCALAALLSEEES